MASKSKYTIKPSTEQGFDLETCFKDKFVSEEGYIKDTDYYFDSYSHFSIHEEMLNDRVRTLAYMNAIKDNKTLFEGKVVMDIGSGTGILSIFAAQAGAKHVYAIENAAIANHSVQIIKQNGLSNKITVIKGKVEEIELPVEHVDIIISEWMGYCLLYEAMFDSVLFARDKYLKKGGQLFPNKADMFIASIEDEQYKEQKLGFWNNVYGFDMTCIKKWVMMEPLVDIVEPKVINSDTCCIAKINLETIKKEELDFSAGYKLNMTRKDFVHGLVVWFDCWFDHGKDPILLSTSPFSRPTHWKSTIFYTEQRLPVNKNDVLEGSILIKKNPSNIRELDIKISYHLKNELINYDHPGQYYRLA